VDKHISPRPVFMIAFILQLVMPLGLLIWLTQWPSRGWIAFSVQALAVAGILIGLRAVAIWAMPPFWVPDLYLILFLGSVTWHLVNRRADGPWVPGTGLRARLLIILLAATGAYGTYLGLQAWQGKKLPAVKTIDIASPFPSGTYLIASGGSNRAVNAHLETLNPDRPEFRNWRGQSRALDIFKISSWGFHVDGWHPRDPEKYHTYGAPLVAPCAGTVARALDGVPDNRVPRMNREAMAGNYLAIHCGENVFVILAHLRNGSLKVSTGQHVSLGEPLGEMGNSGNSSEPHLHIHAQLGLPEDAPLAGEPLGLTIQGQFLSRNDRFSVTGY
jgi:hypothetical protein